MGSQRSGVTVVSKSSVQIFFIYQGHRCRERIKCKPTPANLRRIERFVESIREAIAQSVFEYDKTFPNSPNAARFARYTGANTTVKSYMTIWLASKKSEVKASTFDSYERIVNNQIIPEFGVQKLNEVTRIDVKRWCQGMECTLKRIGNITSVFRAALQDAAYDSLIPINPLFGWQFKRNDPPSPTKDKINPFSKDELGAIAKVLGGQNLNMFTFWRDTGLRHSELIALEWTDIDFVKNTVHVWKVMTDASEVFEAPKTDAGNRVIDLSDDALVALTRQKEHTFLEGGVVFRNPRTGEAWTGDRQIRKIFWEPTLKKAGVLYRNPYQLRHTFASTRLMAATTIGEIMYTSRVLGHRDWVFTAKTYSRFIQDDFFSHQQSVVK
jgi:integrase